MGGFSEGDRRHMRRALALAAKARGMTSPNPMVGAVLVKSGRTISEDYHRRAGEPHAEALAIRAAGYKARGTTIYVTLEPCCHTDKRTPPCTKAIISAGVRKVVIAMRDPNPRVSGKGVEELRRHGIEVQEGLFEEEAKELNEAYVKFITTRTPFVTLKAAMTLDGRIATPEGESKWITGGQARAAVHRMRCGADAVMTAIGTVRADNPRLTARVPCSRQPARIIIDPLLETPPDYYVCSTPPATIIVCSKGAGDALKRNFMAERGVELIEHDSERADLQWLMKELGKRGILSVLVEAGGTFNSACLHSGIVDKAVFFVAPMIIGGKDSIPVVGGGSFRRLADAWRLSEVKVRRVGADIMIAGKIIK